MDLKENFKGKRLKREKAETGQERKGVNFEGRMKGKEMNESGVGRK